jgi:hypothetical protein
MLEDEGTLMAFEEYMTGEGKLATGPGSANAITEYWRSEGITNEDGTDKELADRTATEELVVGKRAFVNRRKGFEGEMREERGGGDGCGQGSRSLEACRFTS